MIIGSQALQSNIKTFQKLLVRLDYAAVQLLAIMIIKGCIRKAGQHIMFLKKYYHSIIGNCCGMLWFYQLWPRLQLKIFLMSFKCDTGTPPKPYSYSRGIHKSKFYYMLRYRISYGVFVAKSLAAQYFRNTERYHHHHGGQILATIS